MIEELGVEVRNGCEFGVDITLPELQRSFDAVVLSVGMGSTTELGIPGEDVITDGLAFIEASKTAPEILKVGQEVLVIGAGNTAIDCATIARRLGAERVTMVYRRTEREMTCYPHEYRFAREEGIEFRFLAQPSCVLLKEGKMTGLECQRVKLGEPDSTGRPAPMLVPGSEFILSADQIIKAVGQQKPSLATALGLKTVNGFIGVDDDFETSRTGVYAIGDCIRTRGAASTVMAVEDGKLAAAAIDKRIRLQTSILEVD
jgi:glutamate synthase (NADPH/NADH) small chain